MSDTVRPRYVSLVSKVSSFAEQKVAVDESPLAETDSVGRLSKLVATLELNCGHSDRLERL